MSFFETAFGAVIMWRETKSASSCVGGRDKFIYRRLELEQPRNRLGIALSCLLSSYVKNLCVNMYFSVFLCYFWRRISCD